MKKNHLLLGLILVLSMILAGCGGGEVVAPPEPPGDIVVTPPDVTVEVDTAAFEAAVQTLADAVIAMDASLDALDAKVDALAVEPEVVAPAEETGGGGDAVILDEDRVPLVTTFESTDEDGNPVTLSCGLALVTANPTYVLEMAKDADGDFKENAAENPLMVKVANMTHVKDEYVCVDSPAIQVDGGKVFRFQYARQENIGTNDDWRGLGADHQGCCFIDAKDVLREFYP